MKRFLSVLLSVVVVFSCLIFYPSAEVHAATTSQQNIVGWADYYYDITWTAQKTVSGWKGNYTYYQGNSYRLPYGQPATKGKYIGYGISVDDFLLATKDADNEFYTTKSYYSGYSSNSVYYATDCSAFVSLCWGIPRSTTYSIPNYGTNLGKISSSTVNNLQIGDCLNSNSAGHVVLVTDVTYSGNNVTSVEITEQTPPQLKRTTYSASSLVSYYGSRGYYIYRYNGNVPAPPQEPETKYWYEDLELVDLGDNFSARIRNVALDVLVTNFNGNVVIGKHYDYKIARQIWNFDRNSDGSYKIKSCLNDYCMELHNFDDFDGGNITCIPDNGSTAQDWFIYLNSDGSYSMRPKCSDERVIDVANGDPTDGNNLQLWIYNKSYSQKFSIEKCGEVVNLGDVFAASIEHTDYWKPIYQDDTDNVVLTTSSKEKMSGILWYFERDEENGWYTITSYKNAKCLEVEDNSTEQGANVQCGDYVGAHGQHWFILKSIDSEGTEYHYIKSACSSNNLDLDYNLEDDGTNIKMWQLNGSDAQKYSIYKIEEETSYSISATDNTIGIGESIDIVIDDTVFVTSYKFHILYPDGKEKVIDNKCNNVYMFTPDKEGKYIVYGEVESPVSKYIGSVSDKSIVIMVEESTVEITSVSIYSAPTKMNYYVGSPFVSAGLKLLVKYSDGTTEIVDTGYRTSGFDSTSTGTKTITVYYKGFSDIFKITVIEKPVATEPTETDTKPIIETEPTEITATDPIGTTSSEPTEITTSDPIETKNTEPTETTVTDPIETTSSEPTGSKPAEITVTEPNESEATSIATTMATDNATEPTEPSTGGETEPTETSTPDETKPAETKPIDTKPTEPIEDNRLLGDVNGDGKVNVKDATLIQKAAAKITKLTDDENMRADVNGDSKVNVKDATAIQKFAAKIETGFPIGERIN